MKSKHSSALKRLALLLALGLFAAAGSAAEPTGHEHHHQGGEDDPHAHHRALLNEPATPATATEVELLDEVLIDQDGAEVKFITDVIGGRIVVMDFVYTTCTTICPVISAVFEQLQSRLGDRLGRDVVLVSLSVDPARDTPQRLKAYATRLGARPGWIWLTGNKRTMDTVLNGLGAYSPNFENHPSMVLVGDGERGEWRRFFGFPSPDRLMEQVDQLTVARNAEKGEES